MPTAIDRSEAQRMREAGAQLVAVLAADEHAEEPAAGTALTHTVLPVNSQRGERLRAPGAPHPPSRRVSGTRVVAPAARLERTLRRGRSKKCPI